MAQQKQQKQQQNSECSPRTQSEGPRRAALASTVGCTVALCTLVWLQGPPANNSSKQQLGGPGRQGCVQRMVRRCSPVAVQYLVQQQAWRPEREILDSLMAGVAEQEPDPALGWRRID